MNTESKKRFIIVSGPVCSGKTTLALFLANSVHNCFYYDKDDLVYTSNVVFDVAGENRDRHSAFFKKWIRDAEYVSTKETILKGIRFNDTVIVNSPYTSELKAESNGIPNGFDELKEGIGKYGAEFIVIFMKLSKEQLKERLLRRKAHDPEAAKREAFIYDDLDKYVAEYDVDVPDISKSKNIDKLFVFDTLTPEASDKCYDELMAYLGVKEYTPYNVQLENKHHK